MGRRFAVARPLYWRATLLPSWPRPSHRHPRAWPEDPCRDDRHGRGYAEFRTAAAL